MQTVYQTDSEGYYVGEEVAFDDPLTPGAVLIPAGCVVDAPPQAGQNQIVKREGGAWTLVPDYRGTVYWLSDRSRHEVTARGIPLPDGALLSEPPKSLVQVQTEKLAQLKQRRDSEIESATVIVAGNTYSCSQEYRELITNIVSRQSRGKPIVSELRDAQGISRTLTPVLLGQIEDAMVAKVEELRQRFWVRHDEVIEAQTIEDVNKVKW